MPLNRSRELFYEYSCPSSENLIDFVLLMCPALPNALIFLDTGQENNRK